MSRKCLVLLGSTGSIGRSALEVVDHFPGRFQIEALAANNSVPLLLRQARRHAPKALAVADPEAAAHVKRRVRSWKKPPAVWPGMEGVRRAATLPRAGLVLSAMVGTAGLLPTLDAIEAGKDVALANKETLVTAGALVMAAARRHKIRLLPVDSEHAALVQCLKGHDPADIRRLILTASGGPFMQTPRAKLRRVTAAEALNHPTWSMGKKITVDSATLMNKGLEVIEAHHLFDVPYDRIEVVIHPQSVVHAMVEFTDGSLLAQMATPDMRLPIQTALTQPEVAPGVVRSLDFKSGKTLTFGPPDFFRFPCLELAYAAGRRGGTRTTVLNAANEIAVEAFLQGRLNFYGIPKLIRRVLSGHRESIALDLPRILEQDAWARQRAKEELECMPLE